MQYSYIIEAIDRVNAAASSTGVSATALSEDTESPVAVIAAVNLLVAKERAVTLSGSGSTDNDEIVSYRWEFGNGAIDYGKTVSYTYASAGSYTVSLTVTDASGNTDTDTVILFNA